jgi:hypothetical protein
MAGLLQWVGKWFQDRQYLQCLSDVQLPDIGISRADLMAAMAAPKDTPERMQSMAAAHGLPRDAVDKEHWRSLDIARACGQCRERAICKRWLNGQEGKIGADAFCPNAKHYAELAMAYAVMTTAHAAPLKGPEK